MDTYWCTPIYVHSMDLNSDPQACMQELLSTEPSFQTWNLLRLFTLMMH